MSAECGYQTVREVGGQGLLELCEENPIIACRDESRECCACKREYEQRLEQYNIEKLLERPECEACGCPLVVIEDSAGDDR